MYFLTAGPIMKPVNFLHYRKMEMVQDAFIVLTPAILILVGVLWFFRKDWIPLGWTNVIASFLQIY